MAAIPATSTDPSENPEKPQTSDGSENAQKVQYEEPADPRAPAGLVEKQSKWNIWKKFGEGQKSDWWFASTGIPLLAATLGPLANVSSIAALVTSWRAKVYIDGQSVPDFEGEPFADPSWCYWLNVASLICGFLGNLFLLLNFTQRIRYIIALPLTIILWYLSTGFLIAITACMHIYARPNRPTETYTQGFWYAIAAAAFYLICSMILMVNMLGYFLGHYPDHFALTDAQRTLILQTMLFFIWLGGGAEVFSRIETNSGQEGWDFADGLYFCDVTILTVGFGDLYPTNDLGRGIVFPYSVGGIIMLGLVISSIYKFMKQLGEENIIQRHIERMRERTMERSVTNSFDLRQREHEAHHLVRKRTFNGGRKLKISAPTDGRAYRTAMGNTVRRLTDSTARPLQRRRKPRLLLLREEKDRFDAMRRIQHQSNKFKKWYALTFSIIAFGILWCVGAVVFWQAEKGAQGMTYFQALYFCYISLLTIGYGDLSPKTNAGRCFFVIWSLIAVPTMTILVSDMGDTVIDKFKRWSNDLADFTVLPKEGIWRSFLDKHPWLLDWLQTRMANRAAKKRLRKGFDTMDPNTQNVDAADLDPEVAAELSYEPPPLAELAREDSVHQAPSASVLSLSLAMSIRRVVSDLRLPTPKRYEYEEWVEFTRLMRLSGKHATDVLEEEDEEGLVDWDWIGEDSPLMSGKGESEWLLGRLTESLVRLERRREAEGKLDSSQKGGKSSDEVAQEEDGGEPEWGGQQICDVVKRDGTVKEDERDWSQGSHNDRVSYSGDTGNGVGNA